MKFFDSLLFKIGYVPAIKTRKRLRYEAANPGLSDRIRTTSSRSEDREQTPRERQKIISDVRDLRRNFSLAGFVIRKHLQSVAWYQFAAKTHNREFNKQLKSAFDKWSRRDQCDAAGRHGFGLLTYLIESHRATDGDIGIIPLRNNKLQLIEGDRIRCGVGEEWSEDWVHGVRIGNYGQAIAYAIAKRATSGSFVHEKFLSAKYFKLLGYYDRNDQIRGVSLLAPAIKLFQKLGDSIDYALAKLKLEQLIGLKTTIDDTSPLSGFSTTEEETESEETESERREREIDELCSDRFGENLVRLALKPGEDASFLDSNNPSQNFQNFVELILRVIFASFDIPYSFFDGSKTNYYGSEGEFEQYIDGIEKKQQPTIELLNEIVFDCLIPNWILDGVVSMPYGWTVEDLRDSCGFYGAGLPSWRMFRKIKEMTLAIQNGFISPHYAVGEYGYDLDSNLDDLAAFKSAAENRGLKLGLFGDSKTNVGL